MRADFLWIAAVAVCWGGYPLVSRSANYGGPRGALLLMVAGLVPIVAASFVADHTPLPSRAGLVRLAVAGVMMGVGLIAFHHVASSSMEASVSIPIVDVAMLLVSAIGAMVFFAEPATLQKGFGIALMLVGIALLRPD